MKKRLTRKEKIIDSLIGCAKKERYNDDSYCEECRFKRGKCRAKLMDAASDYIQLNGRVAAPEIGQDRTGEVYYCGECGTKVQRVDRYCRGCGIEIYWYEHDNPENVEDVEFKPYDAYEEEVVNDWSELVSESD